MPPSSLTQSLVRAATSLAPSSPASNGHATPQQVTGVWPVLLAEEGATPPRPVLHELQTLSAKACEAAQPLTDQAVDTIATDLLRRLAVTPRPTPRPASPALRAAHSTPAAEAALSDFETQVLTLRRGRLTYQQIGERLHCSRWKVSDAIRQALGDRAATQRSLCGGVPPSPETAVPTHAATDAFVEFSRGVRALRAQKFTFQQIKDREHCGRAKIHRALQSAPASTPALSPPASALTSPSDDAIYALFMEKGLSQRDIVKHLGCCRGQVERVLKERKTWDTSYKRTHETSLVALARTILPSPPVGVAVALTADQLAWHLNALEGMVTQLIAIERDREVFARMIATVTRRFSLPFSARRGEFWAVAQTLPDRIAFLDYDGMGVRVSDHRERSDRRIVNTQIGHREHLDKALAIGNPRIHERAPSSEATLDGPARYPLQEGVGWRPSDYPCVRSVRFSARSGSSTGATGR